MTTADTVTQGEVIDLTADAPPTAPAERRRKRSLDADEIRRILPHSWPFLFVDRVLDIEPGVRATAVKNVSVGEPYFAGHFPSMSVMPGVLILEALAQVAGLVDGLGRLESDAPSAGQRGYLASIKQVRFRQLVRPGDQLRLEVTRTAGSAALAEFRVEARVDGRVAVAGSLVLAT